MMAKLVKLLDQTMLELPVEHMVVAMSVSRRFKAVISSNLSLMLDRAMKAIEEDRIKVMLTFAPPTFAQRFVLCRGMTADKMDRYVTTSFIDSHREFLGANQPPRPASSEFYGSAR
jgi:hypothetical protein